jgi:hypothetical protein
VAGIRDMMLVVANEMMNPNRRQFLGALGFGPV